MIRSLWRNCPNATVCDSSVGFVNHGNQLTDAFFAGTDPSRPTLVAIKGIVFDVSKNPAYGPNGQYHGMPILPFPMYCKIIAGLVCAWRY
jgi:hypothetical protein